MKDALVLKIEDAVGDVLKGFFANVEAEYKLPKDALWNRWVRQGDIAPTVVVVAKKEQPNNHNNNKKSDYQTFFSIQRNKMVRDNPTITFGEISKQVSAMWKILSPDEKKHYSAAAGSVSSPKNPEEFRAEYTKMSTTELKNLCKDNGITSKFRKKDDIINTLVEWQQQKKQDPSIILEKGGLATKGRSKLELSAEDKDDDEEDFYFHDDGTSSSGESRACDEDDAGIIISDDEDIFGEED